MAYHGTSVTTAVRIAVDGLRQPACKCEIMHGQVYRDGGRWRTMRAPPGTAENDFYQVVLDAGVRRQPSHRHTVYRQRFLTHTVYRQRFLTLFFLLF